MLIPERLSDTETDQALETVWHAFRDFPFVDPLAKSVALAAIFTAVQRPVLPTAPAFIVDSPIQGSGKTLLAQTLGVIATGQAPTVWPHPHGASDDEIRKRLMAALLQGAGVIVWDNVVGVFDSPAIAAFLTSPRFTDRILGQSAIVSMPNRALFLVTSNNASPGGDLVRRAPTMRLDPQTDRPYARRFDLDPVAYCLDHRQDIVTAVLMLIRAYRQSGASPKPGRLASFEVWDDMVRQPVAWLSESYDWLADPMGAIDAGQMVDPEQEHLSNLLDALLRLKGRDVFNSKDVMDMYRIHRLNIDEFLDAGEPELQAIRDLSECLEDLTQRKISARGIGRILGFREGRIVDGKRLISLPSGREKRWKVEVVT